MVEEENKMARKRDKQIWLGNQRPNQSCFADVECEIRDVDPVVEHPDKEWDSLYDYKLDHFDWIDKNKE